MSRVVVRPDPVVVQVMAEVGIDLAARPSRPARDELLAVAGVLVVMGLGPHGLPVGATVFDDWCIDDPTGKDATTVRYIRDAIDRRVGKLLHRLGVGGGAGRAGAVSLQPDRHRRLGAAGA